jgi:hypothetical protein
MNNREEKSEVPFIFIKYYEVLFNALNQKNIFIVMNDYMGWLEALRALYLMVSHKDKGKLLPKITKLHIELSQRRTSKEYWFSSRVDISTQLSELDIDVMNILGNEYIKKIETMGGQGMDALTNLYKI